MSAVSIPLEKISLMLILFVKILSIRVQVSLVTLVGRFIIGI